MLLMALYTVRSERLFCEQLDYNLLFRWFLDMDMVEESFVPTVFTQNRDRLIEHDVAGSSCAPLWSRRGGAADVRRSLHRRWDAHRGVGVASRASRGRTTTTTTAAGRSGQSRPSTSTARSAATRRTNRRPTPTRKLARKGKNKEAKLSYSAHALMENRNGLLVDLQHRTSPTGTPSAATRWRCSTRTCRASAASPSAATRATTHATSSPSAAPQRHAARRTERHERRTRPSTNDARQPGYAISQRIRKRVEEIFGWMKTVGNFRKTRYVGFGANQFAAYMLAAAYNLVRIATLLGQPA